MKYVFKDEHQGTFGISTMSRVLQASRGGFYTWCRRRDNPSPRKPRQKQLDNAVIPHNQVKARIMARHQNRT